MEGAPFHSFLKADAQPLPAGEAARVRFQLMPTAYRFAKVQLWDQDPLTAKESYANLQFEDLIAEVTESGCCLAVYMVLLWRDHSACAPFQCQEMGTRV